MNYEIIRKYSYLICLCFVSLQELEVLGFSSLRRYKVWPKEAGAGVNTAASSTNVTIGADSEFPPPPVWPIN